MIITNGYYNIGISKSRDDELKISSAIKQQLV